MATENVSDGESHFHMMVVRAQHNQTERASLVVPCARTSLRPSSPSWTSGVERLLEGQQRLLADHASLLQGVNERQAEHARLLQETNKSLAQVASSMGNRVAALEVHVREVDDGLRTVNRRVDDGLHTVSRRVDSLVGATERAAAAAVGARWTQQMLDVLTREAFSRHLPHRRKGALGASPSPLYNLPLYVLVLVPLTIYLL